ncbi:MAG: hypothetical protein OR994_05550 [Candidatus Poseidoniales archaeon]|nr:hypothetical protein [Candidatus Poseidoniales archaeon]
MTTQNVTGVLNCSSGFKIPLSATITDGTEVALTTDVSYTVTAQNIGDFAPGQTVVSGLITAGVNMSYCYILRKGLILSLVPFAVKGVACGNPALHRAVTLQPGDQLRVFTMVASGRNASLAVVTNQGVPRIFIGTSAGASTTQLLDLQTSNTIGETLNGSVIVQAQFTSIDQALITSVAGGAQVTMSNGNLSGAVPASDVIIVQPYLTPASIPVALNFTAQYITSA